MKKYAEQLIIVALVVVLGVTSSVEEPTITTPSTPLVAQVANDILWHLDTDQLIGDTTITLSSDAFFKKPMSFRVFSLKENLLNILGGVSTKEERHLIFECKDGYRPQVSLEDALSGKAYLAYGGWPDSLNQKLAPFYLVWLNTDVNDKQFPWPYALTNIRLQQVKDAFAAAKPKKAIHDKGFELFSNTCMRCHSVNKVGGTLALEFNYPKNITEYWTKENIWNFIQNPQSFRYNSKMPPMTMINRSEFEDIYGYLESMKDQPLSE